MIQINVVPKDCAVAPDWAEIARLYSHNEISVSELCEKFDICQSTLYRRARECGWTLRRTMAQDARSRQPRRFGRQAKLVERLYQTLETFLKIIEDRVAMPENLSAADRERDGRTMNSLVNCLVPLRNSITESAPITMTARRRKKPRPSWTQEKLMRHTSAKILRNALLDSVNIGTLNEFLLGLTSEELQFIFYDWQIWARDDQLPPDKAENGKTDP